MDEQDLAKTPEEAGESAAEGSLALNLHPMRLTLSATKVIVNWRLELRNTGGQHVVGLRIWSDLSFANRKPIAHEEAGKPNMDIAKLHKSPLVAPGGSGECSGEWQMPRDAAEPVRTGPVLNVKEPKVLPVARFRLIGAGIAPTFINFAIGTPTDEDGALPAPLSFDDQMQIFNGLVATQLA